MATQTKPTSYDNALVAIYRGVKNTIFRGEAIGSLREDMRLEGGTALVTGASSGLGFAIAVELARRGVHVYGAARRAGPEISAKLREASGTDRIEMLPLDLSDIHSIDGLLDALEARDRGLDLVVCNAALVPSGSQPGRQGIEQMFMVNYVAKQILIEGLRARGLLVGSGSSPEGPRPRVVIVSSEAHRGAKLRRPETFDSYQDFTLGDVLARYGTYKLALTTFAQELARRLEPEGVAVHCLCPGAVHTNVAREAPEWSKPALELVFKAFFQPPAKAAEPPLFLCLAPEIEARTGVYLHQWVEKAPDERALDPELGRAQWDATAALIDQIRVRAM